VAGLLNLGRIAAAGFRSARHGQCHCGSLWHRDHLCSNFRGQLLRIVRPIAGRRLRENGSYAQFTTTTDIAFVVITSLNIVSSTIPEQNENWLLATFASIILMRMRCLFLFLLEQVCDESKQTWKPRRMPIFLNWPCAYTSSVRKSMTTIVISRPGQGAETDLTMTITNLIRTPTISGRKSTDS
jgi:hypothetical protein